MPASSIDEQILALCRSGNTIAAIKYCRDAYGLGLKASKEYVEGLLSGTQPSPYGPPIPPAAGADLDGQLIALCREGRKLEAIKRYLEATGSSLKQAKEYVDRLDAATGTTHHLAGPPDDLAWANAPARARRSLLLRIIALFTGDKA